MNIDLFGNEIVADILLRDKFIEPPFSVLDTKSGHWQRRKKSWKQIGIESEVGRNCEGKNSLNDLKNNPRKAESAAKILGTAETVSMFDPALCELLYHWFCPQNGTILDPFAGGSVRGIVANYLGYQYTGIDIRQEQIDSNREQAINILPVTKQPQWCCGDSNIILDEAWNKQFDMILSCPPYADLEVYSDLAGDISNKPYNEFLSLYESIIEKSCKLLKVNGYACFVVGEVRDRNGYYLGFVPDTVKAFEKCGMKFYNEAILLNAIASASMRADNGMKNQKLCKVHQNILVFKKIK